MAIPIPADIQRLAAVVSPFMLFPVLIIVPAPKKPIPVTICAAILAGSPPKKASLETKVINALPTVTNM